MIIIREWDINGEIRFAKKKYAKANLEIGSGNGLFLTEIAGQKKDEYYFGIERLRRCINKTKKKIEKLGLENIVLINGDIFTALEKYFEFDFFDNIYINFPDPWFKRRHKKKRVIQDFMLQKISKYLKNEGRIYFVTDNENYRDDGIGSFLNNNFLPIFKSPYYNKKIECYPVSLYEEKWKKQNREIFYSIFKNNIPKNPDIMIK